MSILTRAPVSEKFPKVIQCGRNPRYAQRELHEDERDLVVVQIRRFLLDIIVHLCREVGLDASQKLVHRYEAPPAYEHLPQHHHEQNVVR